MAENMTTLHEICIKFATKQPGMADSLTEDAPILKTVRWKPSTHGLWNVAERLEDVSGPAFVETDAPLPMMQASTELMRTELFMMGGTMEVPTIRAQKFGGPDKYFSERQNALLRKAGMDAERQLMIKNWLRGAQAAKNVKNAGGTGKGWFMVACRFDEINNVGLYDSDQFDQGRLFRITSPYGGAEHHLQSPKYEGVLGYAVTYRAIFGWQLLDPARTVSAIVNIDETHAPTATMIDEMLADVRAQTGSTYIFLGPKAKIYGIYPHKVTNVRLVPGDEKMNTHLETWNDIPIVASHNFSEKIDKITV